MTQSMARYSGNGQLSSQQIQGELARRADTIDLLVAINTYTQEQIASIRQQGVERTSGVTLQSYVYIDVLKRSGIVAQHSIDYLEREVDRYNALSAQQDAATMAEIRQIMLDLCRRLVRNETW